MGRQKNSTRISTKNINFERINKIIFILYIVLINLPMMFRGGYFEDELLPILIGLNMVSVVWLFIQRKNKEFRIFNNPIEILFFGLVIMYLLSIIYGVNTRGSIIESIKYFSYFATIVLAINLAKDKRLEEGILNSIILASVIVSIIGIGTAIGTFDYTDAVLSGRISSTFQYPNTLAAFVGAIYFLTLSMLINTNNKVKKAIYGSVLGILIFTFILTYSRAMWLMFPISVILYFILMPSSRKLETLVYMIGSVIVSVPASFLFTRDVSEPSNKLWIIFLIAAVGTGLIIVLLSLLENKYRSISIKKLVIALTLLLTIVAALGIYAINSTTEITLNNESNENKWTGLTRNITDIQPSTDYKLKVKYTGDNLSEAPYLGRVEVYSISDANELTQLALENISETGGNEYEIAFSTIQNSVGVRIRFWNVYPGTSFTVQESTIIDTNNDESIIDVPLKYKYIPESIVSRFSSITAGESNLTARIRFVKDGLEIIKDYPLLGAGGEGWRTLYLAYQSEPYKSTQAHNFFIQLWIEIGLIGLILFVGILFLLTTALLKTIQRTDDSSIKTLIVGLYVTIFTMLFHAFVDFDMSLAGYAIVLWVIVGVLASNLEFTSPKIEKLISRFNKISKKPYIYVLTFLCIIIIGISGSFILGDSYSKKAVIANESGDIENTVLNFEKAVRYDGYEPTYRLDLANLYMNLYSGTSDTEYVRKAYGQIAKCLDLSPYNTQVIADASVFNFSVGEIEKGLELLERAVELQPLVANSYIQKLDGYFAIFDYYYSEGKDRKAIEMLEEGLTVKEQIAEVNARSNKSLNESVELVYKIGMAQFYLENSDNLIEIASKDLILDFAYYFDIDVNSNGIPDMLHVSKPKGSNIQYQLLEESEDNFVRLTNDGESQGSIYPYGIRLRPNTEYVVDIHARGDTKPETFRAYAWSNGSAEPNQGGLDSIPLTKDWSTHTFEITTDSDVEPGKQYIRLHHFGNDEGYIDIKSVVIYELEY